MKKMPLFLLLLCVSCTPALIGLGVCVGAAGGFIGASVTYDNRALDGGTNDGH
jgi:hypothetical protein